MGLARAGKFRRFLVQIRDQYQRYGNTFASRFLTSPVINTIEPEDISAVLGTNFGDFDIGWRRRGAFAPLLGGGIILTDGARWKHFRAFLRPFLSRELIENLALFESHVNHLVRSIPRDKSTFDLAILWSRLTADILTDRFFGESIHSLLQPNPQYEAFATATREAQVGVQDRFAIGGFSKIVPQLDWKFYKNVKKVHEYIDHYVKKAVGHHEIDSKNSAATDSSHVFLHQIFRVTQNKQKIGDELLTIFLAARDTTATLLSNLFFVLARRPRIWQRLHSEVEELGGKPPTYGQLRRMEYIYHCLNECNGPFPFNFPRPYMTSASAMRVFAPTPANSRIANKDTILPTGGGPDQKSPIFVRKGTMVAYHINALHLREDLWGKDAQEFRPERWQDKTENRSWKFLPFNGGPRVCPGQQFAMTEASYTVVRLVQEFDAIESRDMEPWTESLSLTCDSANGVKVAFFKD